MYVPQLERVQRQLVHKLWVNIVYYYRLTVETIRELPHHFRLLWDGAFSFDDVYNPNAPLHDDALLTTILTSTSYGDDMKTDQLSFDPQCMSPPGLNCSEELKLVDSRGFAAASGTYPYPLTLEPTTPATVPPISLSLLVLVFVGVLIIYKPVGERPGTGDVSDTTVQSQECRECDDRDEQLKATTTTVEHLQSSLAASTSRHQEALASLNASHDQATKELNHTISTLTEANTTLAKDVATLGEESKDQRKTIYEYTQRFREQNDDKKKTPVKAKTVPSTSSQDSKIADMTVKVSELQNRTVDLKEELELEKVHAKESRSVHIAEKEELQKQVNSLHKENASAVSVKSMTLEENDLLKKKMIELEDQIKTKKTARSKHRCEDPGHKILDTLNKKKIHKNEQLVAKNTTLSTTLTKRDAELIDVKRANQSLTAEKAASAAVEGNLRHDLDSVQGSCKTLQDEKNGLQQKSDTMENDLLQLDTDHKAAERKKDELEGENFTLKHENAALKKSEESLEVDKTWFEAQKEALQKQKDDLESQKSAMEKKVDSLQDEKSTLETQKTALETAQENLEKENATLENERTTLKQRVNSLQHKSTTSVASQTQAINVEEQAEKDNQDAGVVPFSPFTSIPTVSSHADAIAQQDGLDYILNYNVFPGKPHISFPWAPKRQRIPRGVERQRREDKSNQDLAYAAPSGPLLGPKANGKGPAMTQAGVPGGPASSMPRPLADPFQQSQQQQHPAPAIFGDRKFESGNYGSYGDNGSYRNHGRR